MANNENVKRITVRVKNSDERQSTPQEKEPAKSKIRILSDNSFVMDERCAVCGSEISYFSKDEKGCFSSKCLMCDTIYLVYESDGGKKKPLMNLPSIDGKYYLHASHADNIGSSFKKNNKPEKTGQGSRIIIALSLVLIVFISIVYQTRKAPDPGALDIGESPSYEVNYTTTDIDTLDGYNAISGSEEGETDAKVCAKKVVLDNLKSPSTAKMCSFSDMEATLMENGQWMISGYVDAQNSFGATMRTPWVVTLTLTSSGFTDEEIMFLE